MAEKLPLTDLLAQVASCSLCGDLPLGPRPVVKIDYRARLLIIGQAPGTRVHNTGIPWNDPSGDNLRSWLGIDREQFYDDPRIAIMPMGFCYPGKGKSGDLPPRKECAPQWHQTLLEHMPDLELILLIGSYAQDYYCGKDGYRNLTERVQNWRQVLENQLSEGKAGYWPLVHPSPRNRLWMGRNPWFEAELLPELRTAVDQLLN
ncbi:uracil-DNA glycosylase family protein [Porticoccus sp. W117]|uniref:uracil-DNA glycosylase family protein n=1 Tax=Porticoccus sp. W117 TaxID=3054777 RepID=UPI00259AC23A|nr:uracil-DNA glycosylase family protein [Porticoccus sp. W117]MDM3870366.1 uracil-DNA glycosylase family protein [Porticoccus sp. W117]